MNMGVPVSFLIMVFSGYMPSSGIARWDYCFNEIYEQNVEKAMAPHSSTLA